MPVTLDWERPGGALLPAQALEAKAEAFYLSMIDREPAPGAAASGPVGFVDEAALSGGRLLLRGWAVDEDGMLPAALSVRIGDEVQVVEGFEKQLRPDVQQHVGLPHALVGYRASVPCAGVARVAELAGRFEVRAGKDGEGDAFRLARPLAALLGAGTPGA